MGFILLGTAVAACERYGADGQPRTDLRSAVLAHEVVYANQVCDLDILKGC